MALQLSVPMITALRYYAALEMGTEPVDLAMIAPTMGTQAALVRRNLIVVGLAPELTDLGRTEAALIFSEYRDFLTQVSIRTSHCDNRWHRENSVFGRMLCPSCPTAEQLELSSAVRRSETLDALVSRGLVPPTVVEDITW